MKEFEKLPTAVDRFSRATAVRTVTDDLNCNEFLQAGWQLLGWSHPNFLLGWTSAEPTPPDPPLWEDVEEDES
jgi:hypothetical protein